MKLKNRITAGLCMALAMVSLLHPFSGEMVYAETAAETREAEEAETAAEAREAEEAETAAETCEAAEAETETETYTHTAEETETAAEETGAAKEAEEVAEETGAAKDAEAAAEETREVEDAEAVTEEAAETETAEAVEAAEEIAISFYAPKNAEGEYEFLEKDESPQLKMPVMRATARTSSEGIDADNPQVGQVNRYEYTGSDKTWKVPATGYYAIYCYGAQGGTSSAKQAGNNRGDRYITYYAVGYGAERASVAKLIKNTVLTVHAGGCGGNGHVHIDTSDDDGYADAGSGGWNDGSKGNKLEDRINDDERYKAYATGGGGGSTYIKLDNTVIISAQGGKGQSVYIHRENGNSKSGNGGNGGGSQQLNNADTVVWNIEELDESTSGINSGNGYVTIEVIKINPSVGLACVPESWTNQDVTITATITSIGEGLPEQYLSWETDDEGNDIWTDETSYTVSQNGTYTCKIRDVEGNIEETSIEITNIDRLQPEGELTADITDWTREDVTLTITADDAEATEAYAKSGLAELPYLWGYRDENGNVIWESKEVGESGEAAPSDPAENENAAGQAEASGGQAAASETEMLTAQTETGQEEAEETQETEESWTDEITHTVSQNGTYLCRVRDKAGNESTYEYTVSNIDRTAPEADYEHPDKWYEGSTTLTWKAVDLQPDGSAGCGLHETPYSYNGTDWTTDTIQEIQAAGTYRIWVRDKLENVAECIFWVGYDKRPSGKKGIDILEPELLPELDADMQPEEILELLTASAASAKGDQGTEKILQRKDESNMRNTDELFAPVFMAEEEIPEALPLLEMDGDGNLSDAAMQSLLLGAEDEQGRRIPWKKIVLYSVWMVTVLCGLLWILFCLLFEHVEVYQKNKQGRYERIGRCALVRKREYTQVNLSGFMKKQREQDYMLRFSHLYVRFHKREKVLIRTLSGIELRNVARKIEVLC